MNQESFSVYVANHLPSKVWDNNVYHALAGSDGNYKLNHLFYIVNKIYPSTTSIEEFDALRWFKFLIREFIIDPEFILQDATHNVIKNEDSQNELVIMLTNDIILKINPHDFRVTIFHSPCIDPAIIEYLKSTALQFPSNELLDNNLVIITDANGYIKGELMKKPICQPLEIEKLYNDDFLPINLIITERLEKQNDKGLVLLHGIPGTGKTNYIRHLICVINKKFILINQGNFHLLGTKEFITFLLDYKNAILIIEDAEEIIRPRAEKATSAITNLLNISDGILSDVLNIQIVITFNTDLSRVDSALMRKGRLIANYDFKALDSLKAQALSNSLGLTSKITQAITLAEIFNQDKMNFSQNISTVKIGFGKTIGEEPG